jgi:hypothetical protein
MIIVAILPALALLAWWLCSSPLRIGIAIVIAAASHSAPSGWWVAALASLFATFAAVIVWRALRESGWSLMVSTGGVA